MPLLYQSVYQSLFSDFCHSWIPPQGTWTSPPAAVYFRSLAEYNALGVLRDTIPVFLMLISIPAWSRAAENRSNACWRPYWEDLRMQYQLASKKQRFILQFLTATPPSRRLWLSIPAMSNPRPACGPVEDFARRSLGFGCSKSILHTDNQSLFW